MDVRGKSETGPVGSTIVLRSICSVLALALAWAVLPIASYAQQAPLPARAAPVRSASAPAPPQSSRLPLQPVDTLFVVQVAVPSAAQLGQLQRMGHACAGLGMCRLEVSGQELSALKEAGLEATVVEQAVAFSTQASAPSLLAETFQYGENSTDIAIPDFSGGLPGTAASEVEISTALVGSVVTKIKVTCRVVHTFPGDLEINVGHEDPSTYITLWNRYGGGDDGGADDDAPSDDDIELYDRTDYTHFDGDWVNQRWYLQVLDHSLDDTGYIDYIQLWVYYCPPIDPPTLDSPVDNSILCDTTPFLQWNTVSGADNYRLQVDNDSGFGSPELNVTVLAFNYQLTTPLPAGDYWWRVRAHDECGWGRWSEVWKFSIKVPPTPPTWFSPVDGTHTCDATPTLDWSDVGSAWGYRVEVDNDASFSTPEVVGLPLLSEYTPVTDLAPGQYYWRVLASNNCGDSPWSGVRNFVIDTVPAAPTLISPAHNSHTCDTTPVFAWQPDYGANLYTIQVDNNDTFSSPEVDTTTVDPEYTPSSALAPGTYYWRVRSHNHCGRSYWSDVRTVTIDATPDAPVLFAPIDDLHVCDATPEFSWDVSFGATSYRIQVDDNASFSSPEINATTAELHYTAPAALAPGSYHWRVRSISGSCAGPWSPDAQFTIDAVPAAPSSPSPADGATGVPIDANLDWADASGATSYDVHFGTSATPPFVASVTSSQYGLSTLTPDTLYYWKIVAKNAGCQTEGPVWHFRTAAGGANHPPTNGTITPNSGGAPARQIVYFTTTWSDPDGEADLKACRLHIGRVAAPKSLIGNAVLLYQARTNKIMIRNDRGTRWWGGKAVGSDNVVQNSQAKVYCNLTTVTRSGNTITVRWAVEFKPAFRGATKMYLKARDVAGLTSNLEKKGTWTVQ